MIRLYNTLSGKKETFEPLRPGAVSIYVCGVTTYDHCHIGHARSAVAFDIVRRYFAYRGYQVTFVKNYTDIDDKIINRAKEQNVHWQELAERFIAEHDQDMAALFVDPPTIAPKATEHIDHMVVLINFLLEKGYAYQGGSDVFFRVRRFAEYGQLSGKSIEDLQSGSRVEVNPHKEDPLDFVLWKGEREGEPSWEAPFGRGRPGWHIECSAMGHEHLGESFDIHGGGKDLIFPHHENEIAQSCAGYGCAPVRYWMHNGFVNINDEKMSKSLGNFFTIKEILQHYDAEVVRLFLAQTHYRSPIDFCDANLDMARQALEKFYRFLEPFEGAPVESSHMLTELAKVLQQLETDFCAAMDDDFNSALAIAALFESMHAINRLQVELQPWAGSIFQHFTRLGQVLGIFQSRPSQWFARHRTSTLEAAEIESLIEQRTAARKNRDFAEADRIREVLLENGVEIQDGKGGTSWRYR
ncbi:cysteine--tRNA ligase [Desulfurispira natronophila]|uniref:Cysteine--tRNA ligase n=1 Tax=Desulfurispira natronophila TaxID=682562 RepID=A0A7W8DFV0_9BACT|nr:cysteine--tRNA ligase [Desulfurispira natronophila]MBB5020700.1 cysteinyl-tRNA synthetase [Desulfurispira natronophila]